MSASSMGCLPPARRALAGVSLLVLAGTGAAQAQQGAVTLETLSVEGSGAGVVGGATAGLMEAFIQDKNASGDAKETYRLIGYGGLGLAAVGVVVAVVGGVIFVGGEQ